MKENVPTYVIHYTKNTTRKKLLSSIFDIEKFNNVLWVEAFDREQVLYEHFRDHFNVTETEFDYRRPTEFHWELHRLKAAEVSLILKQKLALQHFTQSAHDVCLVLEDDAIVADDFVSRLDGYCEELPNDWEFAFVGQGLNKRIPKEELVDGVHWYKKTYPADRCADSMLIKKSAAQKILRGMTERGVCFPIDHEYAFWFRELNINVYWLEPPLVSQGSQCGLFESFQDSPTQYCNQGFRQIRSDLDERLASIRT